MTIKGLAIVALVALCIFLELIIIRLANRKDGVIVVNKTDPMKDTYKLELYIPFGELDNRKDVVFRVRHE